MDPISITVRGVVGTGTDAAPASLQVGVGTHASVDGCTRRVEHGVAPQTLAIAVQVTPDVGELAANLIQWRIHGHVAHRLYTARMTWVVHVRHLALVVRQHVGLDLTSIHERAVRRRLGEGFASESFLPVGAVGAVASSVHVAFGHFYFANTEAVYA